LLINLEKTKGAHNKIVNNGMLINMRENQRGNEKIQSSRTSNIRHIRHIVKTRKATEN
jgi:hypothetical protein